MALVAGAAAALASLSSSLLSKPSLSLIPIRTLPRLTCSLATSSSSQEFNITFAPPKPKPKPDSLSSTWMPSPACSSSPGSFAARMATSSSSLTLPRGQGGCGWGRAG
ncbi:hypothetical protein ACFX12_035192 [Malus domestica]